MIIITITETIIMIIVIIIMIVVIIIITVISLKPFWPLIKISAKVSNSPEKFYSPSLLDHPCSFLDLSKLPSPN